MLHTSSALVDQKANVAATKFVDEKKKLRKTIYVRRFKEKTQDFSKKKQGVLPV